MAGLIELIIDQHIGLGSSKREFRRMVEVVDGTVCLVRPRKNGRKKNGAR